MTDKRTHVWTDREICPTCGNDKTDKISRVNNGITHDSRRAHALRREGCSCDVCGAMWHQWEDVKTGEHLVKEIIQEGDLYAEDDNHE